jgi:hypothetical protein
LQWIEIIMISRRDLLKHLGVLLSTASFQALADAIDLAPGLTGSGNFSYIYGDLHKREAFFPFLANVFHLYPEKILHDAITRITAIGLDDGKIYQQLQHELPAIQPFLSELTYALPALWKQKRIMAAQTYELLGDAEKIDGYLEFGSGGRYLDVLEGKYQIGDRRYFVADRQSGYSPSDIIDRGQLSLAGEFISLDNYAVNLGEKIRPSSLDIVTVYIGFHHCPLALRDTFISGVRDVLKPGGALIVRDHNAHDEDMRRCVSLAHDVFNMGTGEAWGYNAAELRNFYSLDMLDAMLSSHGFKTDGRRLFQSGDPTLNALMLYRKV